MRAMRATSPVVLLVSALVSMLVLAPGPSQAAKPSGPAKPSVKTVSPATGTTAGGVRVTIKGRFPTGARSVLFGSTRGTGLKVRSARKLSVVAPAHLAGVVDVVVVTRSGRSRKLTADRFTYLGATTPTPPPTLPPTPPTTPPMTTPTTPPTTSTPPAGPGVAIAAPLPAGATPGGSVTVRAVSCPSAGECVAVGRFAAASGDRPLAEVLHAGVWTPVELPLPAGAATTNAGADLLAVSCPTTTSCAAVGRYSSTSAHGLALLETWNGTTWSASSVAVPGSDTNLGTSLAAVHCTSATSCAAVGSYPATGSSKDQALIVAYDGSTWSVKATTPPAGTVASELLDVACPAAGSCVAVGGYSTGSGADGPLVTTLASGSWTSTAAPLPNAQATSVATTLDAVSCPTVGSCTAVGYYTTGPGSQLPVADRLVAGTWSTLRSGADLATVGVPADAYVADPAATLSDVACPTIAYCAFSGTYRPSTAPSSTRAMVVTVSGSGTGSGSSASPSFAIAAVTTPGASTTPDADLPRIVCPSTGGCAAVGRYQVTGAGDVGLYARVSGDLQPGVRSATPAGAATPFFFTGLASDTSSTAVGVGGYTDSSAHSQGLLVTGVPVGPGFM